MTFLFGGCLDGIAQYQIDAEFQMIFTADREDGGRDVEYHYKSAVATAATDDAVNALSDFCGFRFQKGVPQNVLGCLFCPVRYDIYLQLEDGIFVLGDGITCDVKQRPTNYEESKYVLLPYYNGGDGGNGGNGGSYGSGYYTVTGSFSYVNYDDDAEDDFFPDEDDEVIGQDDDDDYFPATTNFSTNIQIPVVNTVSNNSPDSSSSGTSSLSVAFASIIMVALILI
eukprot:CAMPEP_0117038286 /NCGR_PEP_ID=MMETSP0472-20121206/26950_1 /TAXON_ID=693140 ORGANISM="Tiarina fusus, Strain LIS" /NCGR_SAMPLE_ID=MMETSP0472 /ASSEMBLY_ACC=CAM_ASM_000603 /LENGTH=225 /DNA_ID=CAMNT_0004748471 /DNA_START=146 /DNA_END=823 /DNA_ORIENTATION=+